MPDGRKGPDGSGAERKVADPGTDKRRKAVRLSDIADVLGVSPVTVSNALADQKGVGKERREQIKALAREMGYRPSAALSGKKRRSENIGVLVAKRYWNQETAFYWKLYEEITAYAAGRGAFTIFESVRPEDERAGTLPSCLLSDKVEALMVLGRMDSGYLEKLKIRPDLPLVFLDFYTDSPDTEGPGADCVISNGYHGMYMLTNLLYRLGHRKIAFVGSRMASESVADRYFGYRKALFEHGMDERRDWILPDYIGQGGRWVIELPEELPTAFVCSSDPEAAEVIRLLKEQGRRVPQDISVAGFNHYTYPGMSDVGITTYETDQAEMAKMAVERILERLSGANSRPCVLTVMGRVIVKESTGIPNMPEP